MIAMKKEMKEMKMVNYIILFRSFTFYSLDTLSNRNRWVDISDRP